MPKFEKGSIIKWIESFKLHCSNVVGVQNCPIVYVIDERKANTLRPALAANQPHSEEYGAMEIKLLKLLSWDHLLFKNDNNHFFDRMERALIGTPYASTIVRFRKGRDGNKAMAAIISQHAGKDVWENRIKHSEDYMVQKSWTGQTRQTLVAHIDRHRQSYVALIEAAYHVSHQKPSERTRVS